MFNSKRIKELEDKVCILEKANIKYKHIIDRLVVITIPSPKFNAGDEVTFFEGFTGFNRRGTIVRSQYDTDALAYKYYIADGSKELATSYEWRLTLIPPVLQKKGKK